MASPYIIPPWFNQPNPVDTYTRGLQIGTEIGKERAAQELRREVLDREQQKALVEEEVQKAKIHLAADAQARRYAAQKHYQDLIDQGVPPEKALLMVGPAAGTPGGALSSAIHFPLWQQNAESLERHRKAMEANTAARNEEYRLHHMALEEGKHDYQDYHDANGAITRVYEDGTVETLKGPMKKTVPGARYSFKKDNGDTVSGTIDDPEIAALVEASKQQPETAQEPQTNPWSFEGNMPIPVPSPSPFNVGGQGPVPAPQQAPTSKKYRFDPTTGKIAQLSEASPESPSSTDDEEMVPPDQEEE